MVVDGHRNVVEETTTTGSSENGIEILGGIGNRVVGCRVSGCAVAGLSNQGASTSLINTTFSNNGEDVVSPLPLTNAIE